MKENIEREELLTDIETKVRQVVKDGTDDLRAAVLQQGSALKKLSESGVSSDGSFSHRKSLGDLAVDAFKAIGLDGKLEKGAHKTIVLKTVGTMTTGNIFPSDSGAIPYSLSDNEPGLTRIVKRRPWIIELANTTRTNKMYVQWSEKEGQEGTAGETAEGTKKNQIDFNWVEKSKKVEKLTAFIKVSKEALDDLPSLGNEINTELREEVLLKTDDALLDGDGTTPTLDGILNQATAYSAGVFAGTVVSPNNFDVLRTAIAQVVRENFSPNAVVLHPDDVATMDLSKSEMDEHYVLPPFKSADGMVISGVRIVENTGVDQGDFLVGDFKRLNVRIREDFKIDVGFEDDDFTLNLVTILGEIRLASYIKGVHQKAFVFGDFETAIAALLGS